MIKLSNKIISSIVGVVIAGGAITVTAATVQPKSAVSAAPVSSTTTSSTAPASSATVSSEGTVSNVDDGLKRIKEATDNGVSAVNEAAKNAVSDVNSAAKSAGTSSHVVKATRSGYGVFDPDTGVWLSPSQSRYNDVKKELGGDAGIVPEKQSTACQKAVAEYNAKMAKEMQAKNITK